jgi:hypothetical protein
MKTFTIFCLSTFALIGLSFAQPTASPKASHTAGAKTTSTNGANEATGSVVELVPGQSLVLNTGTQNQHFKLAAQAQYFNPKGKQIQERKVKKDRKVRVHYAKQGDDMVVDRITLVREGGRKKGKPQAKKSASQQQ